MMHTRQRANPNRQRSYGQRGYRRRAQDGLVDDTTRELTILPDGRIIAAVSAEESAAPEGPHPGLALAGDGAWESFIGAHPSELGLPYPLLAYQSDGSVRPAVEEFHSTLAAAQDGNALAQQVIAYLSFEA